VTFQTSVDDGHLKERERTTARILGKIKTEYIMDFDDEPIPPVDGSHLKKNNTKKTVVIDDNKDIKFINVESSRARQKRPFCENINLYEWPWRILTVLFLIGYLFHVIAFGTPFWMITSENNGNDVTNVGIWSACTTISNCTMPNGEAGNQMCFAV